MLNTASAFKSVPGYARLVNDRGCPEPINMLLLSGIVGDRVNNRRIGAKDFDEFGS
jgi:hypothetical protein